MIKKGKKNILLSGYYGHGNTGDEAILMSIADQLRGHELTVVSLDPGHTRRLQGIAAIDFFKTEAVEDAVRKSDVVVMGGGGLFQEFPETDYYEAKVSHLFHNPYGKLVAFAIVPILASVYRKPLVFLGHGIGPFYSDGGKAFYSFILSLASWITVRDRYSYSWVAELGRKEGVHLSADPAFLLRAEEGEKVDRLLRAINAGERTFLMLSLREWVYSGMTDDVVNAVAGSLSSFLRDRDMNVLFIPFQEIQKGSHPTRDRQMALRVMERLDEPVRKRFVIIDEALTPGEVLTLTGRCLFGIGMRYHSLIFSFLCNVPVVSISYDEKCHQLMKEAGMEDLSLDSSGLNRDSLLSCMNRIADRADEYKRVLAAQVPLLRQRAMLSFSLLGNFIEEEPMRKSECPPEAEHLDVVHEMKNLVFYKEEKIRELRKTLEERISTIESLNSSLTGKEQLMAELKEKLSGKDRAIETLRSELEDRKEVIEEKERAVRELDSRLSQVWTALNAVYSSKTWKIGQFYGKLFGVESKWRRTLTGLSTKRKYASGAFEAGRRGDLTSEKERVSEGIRRLKEFLHEHRDKKEIYFIICAAPFLNRAGQRGVRFARELSLLGKPVVYLVSLQHHIKDEVQRIDDHIFSYPLNWFLPVSGETISSPLLQHMKKVMIFQVPFYGAFEVVSHANACGWVTVYDIVDDWESFHDERFIAEYDRETEHYLAANSDVLVAVNQSLRNKFRDFGDISLIPNGYSPALLGNGSPKELKRGEITSGFFGHLHQARFNWELMINVAKRQRGWLFYIIGFGEPAGLVLPDNIVLTGAVEPSDLSRYAKNWDVALIPYQYNELCRKLNPIKIFEYLYFGLPIVATGCEDVKNYPYSFYAHDEDEFISLIREASGIKVEKEKISGLLNEATWENRLRQMFDAIKARDNYKDIIVKKDRGI